MPVGSSDVNNLKHNGTFYIVPCPHRIMKRAPQLMIMKLVQAKFYKCSYFYTASYNINKRRVKARGSSTSCFSPALHYSDNKYQGKVTGTTPEKKCCFVS